MSKRYLLLVVLVLPLIAGMGLNFSCASPDEKASIDYMLQMVSAVNMASGEVTSMSPLPIKTRGAAGVSAASTVQNINRKGFNLGLNLMGIKTAQELAEPPAPQITGPDNGGWYSLNYVYAGSEQDMTVDVDIKSKARLLKNGSTPVSVDISKLTNETTPPTEADFEAAMTELLEGIDGATSLKAVFELSGDALFGNGTESIDLKDINVDIAGTINFTTPLNIETFDSEVSTALLEADLGCKTVIDDKNVQLRLTYEINIDVENPDNSTGTISYTIGTGFLYLDTFNLTATVTAGGTTTGTISHGGETVAFTIENGTGTYVYKGVTYDISTGEPVS